MLERRAEVYVQVVYTAHNWSIYVHKHQTKATKERKKIRKKKKKKHTRKTIHVCKIRTDSCTFSSRLIHRTFTSTLSSPSRSAQRQFAIRSFASASGEC